ncbi:MAG: DUF6454 family protein [Polyangiales bacterium]
MKLISLALAGLAVAGSAHAQPAQSESPLQPLFDAREDTTTRTFRLLGRNAIWTPIATVETDFDTFHTEGLVKVGDAFFVSAVEVTAGTVRNEQSTDSLYDFTIDRSAGAGRGWLFKFDGDGHLLGKVELTRGDVYHPGGIDFDGQHIWVPVAEYRPNSASDIYRVDPDTLEAQLVFTEQDHIGGIVHDTKRHTFHGVSWGSRRFYTWHERGKRVLPGSWTPNPSFYIDYQDCHGRGVGFMLCGGLTSLATPVGAVAFGGLELVDLWRNQPVHQIPVNQFVDEGAGPKPTLALTHNPFWVEPIEGGRLRFYFMPESDSKAELRIFDVTPWVNRP